MINTNPKVAQLRTFVMLRLFIVTLLLFLGQVVFRMESLVFYYLIAGTCFLSLFYLVWLVYENHAKMLAWVQIVFDTLLETVLVQLTGGVDSLFAPIYILSIISAGIIIGPKTSFTVAGLSSILFAVLVVCDFFQIMPGFLLSGAVFQVDRDPLYLFYATYVRITIFFVVAILTNYLAGTIRQLEEKVKLQERLVFLGDTTSQIAHEIRNPLAAIHNSVEVLSEELKTSLSEKNKKLMSAVIDESERLKRIFDKILMYARNEKLEMRPIKIENLLERVLMLFAHSNEFQDRGIQIIKKYTGKSATVCVDEECLVDILSNIIRNAYEAMRKGGDLSVDFSENSNEIELVIADTGEGVKKEVLKNLFVPFKTTKKTGTGLGLAQAHKIITMHGGEIRINSKQGQGTQVFIALPL